MEQSDLQRGCELVDRKHLGLIPAPVESRYGQIFQGVQDASSVPL
jgi:hypothetical protein